MSTTSDTTNTVKSKQSNKFTFNPIFIPADEPEDEEYYEYCFQYVSDETSFSCRFKQIINLNTFDNFIEQLKNNGEATLIGNIDDDAGNICTSTKDGLTIFKIYSWKLMSDYLLINAFNNELCIEAFEQWREHLKEYHSN